jgi:hypothetical protein
VPLLKILINIFLPKVKIHISFEMTIEQLKKRFEVCKMKIIAFPFTLIDWATVEGEKHAGITGFAEWKIKQLGDVRIRMVEYSPNYLADHWCDKGHIIFCVDGRMTTELKDGRKILLEKGMTYIVGDDSGSHRTFTETGVKLFIVD